MNFLGARQSFRPHPDRCPGAPGGNEQAERAPCQRQQNALGQKLPDQAPRTRSERGAYRQFSGPPRRAGQKQIRDVGAGDQQYKAHGGKQHQQKRPNISNHIFFQRDEGDARILIDIRIYLAQVRRDAAHVRFRLLQGDSWRQPSHGIHAQAGPPVAEQRIAPIRAARCASVGGMPARVFSSISISRWE